MDRRPAAALALLVAVLAQAEPATAQDETAAGALPVVRLEPPGFDRTPGAARRPAVRVLVQVRNCTARPTVTVVGSWRRRSGGAVLEAYVFATDFRARAAVAVARFESLAKHVAREALANEKVKADAECEVNEAKAASDAARKETEAAKREAEQAKSAADQARQAAEDRNIAASERIYAAEDRVEDLEDKLDEAESESGTAGYAHRPVKPQPAYLGLHGIEARVSGWPTKIYGVESVQGAVRHYLVRVGGGRLRWVPEADVTQIGADEEGGGA